MTDEQEMAQWGNLIEAIKKDAAAGFITTDSIRNAIAAARREGMKEALRGMNQKLKEAVKMCEDAKCGTYTANAWRLVDAWIVSALRRVEEGGEL